MTDIEHVGNHSWPIVGSFCWAFVPIFIFYFRLVCPYLVKYSFVRIFYIMSNSHKIYIGNLPFNTKSDILRSELVKVGINPVKILVKKNFALVDLPEEVAIETAITLAKGMYGI